MAEGARLPDPQVRMLTRELLELRERLDRLERGQRATQLGNSSIEDGFLRVNDSSGVGRLFVGRQPDGKFGWGAANGEPPPRPNTPVLTASLAGVTVSWNGEFAGVRPSDFTHVNVYLSPVGPTFIPGESNLRGQLFGAGDMPVTPLDTEASYWCKLVAHNSSGVASEESLVAGPITPAQVVAQALLDGIVTELALTDDAVTAAAIAAGAVGETEIADDSITTPKVRARAITAAEIAVATILAEHLSAGSVTAGAIQALAVTADHVAANAIQAGHIEAGSITADKLASVLILASKIVAGDPAGWRLEMGDSQTPILWWDGTTTGFAVSKDAVTGASNVYLSGRVHFGSGSQIEQDYLDLAEQPATGFQQPSPRQARHWIDSGMKTSVTARWTSATQPGNLILLGVFQAAPTGGAPTCSTPPDSTLIWSQVVGLTRLSLFYVPDAPTSRTSEVFTSVSATRWAIAMFEYTGIAATAFDVFAVNSGTSALADSGTTSATSQADELHFAMFGSPSIGFTNGANGQWTNPTNSFTKVLEGDGVGGQGIAVATKVASSTLATSTALTVNKSVPWQGIVATFRSALAAGVPPQPRDGTLRLFSQERAGFATPHVIDDTGAVYPVGRIPYCRVRLNVDVELAANTDTYAQGDWVIRAFGDPYGMVALGGGGSFTNITIPVTGLYRVSYRSIFQTSASHANVCACFVTLNSRTPGASIARDLRHFNTIGNDGTIVHAQNVLPLAAGDILYWGNYSNVVATFYVWTFNANENRTEINVTYLGPVS